MKLSKKILGLSLVALASTACDEATTNNPGTAARDDLNPPTGLVTITGDKSVTLRWLGNNTEADFQGYQVFMAKGDVTGMLGSAAWTAVYPTGNSLTSGSVPRCKDNNDLFKKFGFPESKNSCEGDTATDSETTPSSALADEAPEETLPFVQCDGKSNSNVSLPASGKVLGSQECKVTGLTNGETYSFVVMSVMGTDFSKVSWTSNFVSDTPANVAMSSVEIVIEQNSFHFLSHADLLSTIKSGAKLTADKFAKAGTCHTTAGSKEDICSIGKGPNKSTNPGGLYFGRYGGSKPARVFFSTPKDHASEAIVYLYRGGQTFDPQTPDVVATSVPGDMANNDRETNYGSGNLLEVLGNEVIDIAVQSGSDWHFGKLVLDLPSLETATEEKSKLKFKITLVMQPKAGNPHYLQ